MVAQLFVFALLFAGFGVFALIRKKKLIGIMFVFLGLMLFVIASLVIYLYPEKSPF